MVAVAGPGQAGEAHRSWGTWRRPSLLELEKMAAVGEGEEGALANPSTHSGTVVGGGAKR